MLDTLLANPELATLLGGLLASAMSSGVSAMFPDKASKIMKFINLMALNVGNAKNDESINK